MEEVAQCVKVICAVEHVPIKGGKKIMTNREYAIKKINGVLERVDDTRLAEIIIEVMGLKACKMCLDDDADDEADCTRGIRKWLQSENTSKQY